MADEQTGSLLQGMMLEWRGEVEKIREVRRLQEEVELSSAADRAQREMQRQRQLRNFLGMGDEQTGFLLQGMMLEWMPGQSHQLPQLPHLVLVIAGESQPGRGLRSHCGQVR